MRLPTIIRLQAVFAAFLFAWGIASSTQAKIHSLSGNARLQLGAGIPLPVGFFAAVPNGGIQAVTGATVRQHGAHTISDPARVVLDPGQLTHPGTPINLQVFVGPGNLFQVRTALPMQFPKSKVLFEAGGRTGAATVTVCPGSTVPEGGNPACASASAGLFPGRITYTRTSRQFGGPARIAIQGSANIALQAGGAFPPCGFATDPNCLAFFVRATPPSMHAVGAPFDGNLVPRSPLSPGVFRVSVTPAGQITNITATGLGPGPPNTMTSFGGPWTTGRVRVEQPAAFGSAQTFVLSGADGRAASLSSTPVPSSQTPNGTGSLSLVAGGVSQAFNVGSISGNRGWLNLSVGPRLSHVPLLPGLGLATVFALLGLLGARRLYTRTR